jgi:hypothetical protein
MPDITALFFEAPGKINFIFMFFLIINDTFFSEHLVPRTLHAKYIPLTPFKGGIKEKHLPPAAYL